MDASLPKTFGRYEIRTEIGSGAMGIVYHGFDPEIGREVAIKTIKRTLDLPQSKRVEYLERFRREAQAAGRLSRHPNIVPVYDMGLEGDLPYIVMAFVDGESLDRLRRRTTLSDEILQRTIADTCKALEFAHSVGIVHRDVKPANILITPEAAALTDFGIARIEDSELTRTGTFLGSPSYMSPEQVRGWKVDGRSDLFSLAVILYMLLTGQKPFPADDTNGILYKIVHEPHNAPSTIDPALARWNAFFDKALAKDADNRFADAAEWGRVFAEVAGGLEPRTDQDTYATADQSASSLSPLHTAPLVSAPPASVPKPPTFTRQPDMADTERRNPFAEQSMFFNMDVKSRVSPRRAGSTTGSGRVERMLRGALPPRRRTVGQNSISGLPPIFWAGLVAGVLFLAFLVIRLWPEQ